jgi:transcriptional regulator NrdR family protein
MLCPECGKQVYLKSHNYLKDGTTSRMRRCSGCRMQFYTVEISKAEYQSLKVLSNDLRWAVDRYLKGRKQG